MFAVLSDVHANLEALLAVLEDLNKKNIRDIFFAGDAVGYGPDPNECLRLLAVECTLLVAGNHDWGVCGLTDVSLFNEHARRAINWTKHVIGNENAALLKKWPLRAAPERGDITVVHASPFEPEYWHYLTELSGAELNMQFFETTICAIGHTHRPFIVEQFADGNLTSVKGTAVMRPGGKYIVNAGSVGQPRDGDPRAAYAVFAEDSIEIVRVAYDVGATQKKMKEARLPLPLIERLALGR